MSVFFKKANTGFQGVKCATYMILTRIITITFLDN